MADPGIVLRVQMVQDQYEGLHRLPILEELPQVVRTPFGEFLVGFINALNKGESQAIRGNSRGQIQKDPRLQVFLNLG